MTGLGIITGRAITQNRDGDSTRVILQVELIAGEDVRTVELFAQAGEDVNPANGCRVVVVDIDNYKAAVAVSDDLTPECDPGEREIYSTDNPVSAKLARTKWDKDGNVIHNEGTDNPVKWSELNTIFANFITALNAEFSKKVDGGGSPGSLTLDLSTAKSATVFIP